jgi:tRNA1(Val) A37 N6-methylase TrmN6
MEFFSITGTGNIFILSYFEIDLFLFISTSQRESGADAVVDVGSGKGALAHVLAFRHGVRVVAVDTQVRLTLTRPSHPVKLNPHP